MNINHPMSKAILFLLLRKKNMTLSAIAKNLDEDKSRVKHWLQQLLKEQYVIATKNTNSMKYNLDKSVNAALILADSEGMMLTLTESNKKKG